LLSAAAGLCLADASAQLKQANDYKMAKQYEQAEAIYQQIVTGFPGSNDALEAQKQLTILYITTDSQEQADAALQQLLVNFSGHKDIAQAVHDIAYQYRCVNKQQKANQIDQNVVNNWPRSDYAVLAQMDLAKYYVDCRDDPNAEAALDKLIANFSNSPLIARGVHDVAQHYRGSRKYDKANQLYQYTIDHWPQSEHALWSQADLIKSYLALGDEPNAEAAVDELLANFNENPIIARAVWDTAHLYRGLKKYQKANRLYQHIIDHWPQAEHAIQSQTDLIKSHLALGNDTAAQAATDKLLGSFSEHPLIARSIWDTGQHYRNLKKYEMANQLYQYVIDKWPRSEPAMWAQADLIKSYLALADETNAEAAVDKLLTDFNDSPLIARAVWDTGQLYRGLKKYDKANRLYQHVVKNWPVPEHAMWSQADLIKSYLALKDDPNAEAAVDKLLTDFNDIPLIARAIWDTARLYRDLKKYEKAKQLYQHVIDDYPHAEHAILSQIGVAEVNVLSHIDAGNDSAAQAELDILIADFNDQPELPQTLLSISEQYFYRHNYKRATELWVLMLSKYPESSIIGEILYPLATCCERLKESQNAIKYFTKLIEQYPNGPYAYRAPYKLALIYRRQKQYDKAIYWFQRQRQLYSREPYGDRALYCEGLIYLNKLKDYRKAADIFQEYIETYPNGERLLAPYRLAVCYEEMGQRAQAIELLQQGLMEYSDTVYAETYMKKLMQLQ